MGCNIKDSEIRTYSFYFSCIYKYTHPLLGSTLEEIYSFLPYFQRKLSVYVKCLQKTFQLTFHAAISMRRITHPTRATIVGDLLSWFVTYNIAKCLFVYQLDTSTHLIYMRLRLTWCTDMLPNGTGIDFSGFNGHCDCALLHAYVSSAR